jgi:hypothetical protein
MDSDSSGSFSEASDKSKDEIIELIKNESQDISREIASGKNPKWKQFNRILHLNRKTDFIECINCKEVLTHKKLSRTSVLTAHKYKIQIEKHTKIDDFFSKKAQNINFNAIKSELTDAIVMCCATDMRSFTLVEGEGFKILAQK